MPAPPTAAAGSREASSGRRVVGGVVNRLAEIAEVEALLDEERLVALLGPSGIGKTFLADALARRSRWKGRVIRVGCDDVADLAVEVARVLGAEGPGEPTGRALARRGACLLVLDAMEAAPPGLADGLEAWTRAAPQARIVITSTRRPHLAGLRCWEVPPLSADESVSLLVGSAARLGAAGWSGAERRTLEDLAHRLDGSPLALQLASGRARVMRPRQLLSRLDQGFDVLRTQGTGRHASAEASVRWMWDRLSPKESDFLTKLSVFEGGFPLEALEVVHPKDDGALDRLSAQRDASRAPGEDDETLDLLSALRDASLVRIEGERYRLPEAVRWHAARELERRSPEAHARRRHAAWCTTLFSELPGDDESLPRLVAERANLLAAHRFCLEHDPALAARVALGLGRALAIQGPAEVEESILDTGVEAARQSGERKLLGRLLRERGMYGIRLGRLAEARLDLEEFETIARAAGDRLLEVQAGIEQGRLRFAGGDFDTAQVLLSRGLEQLVQLEGSEQGGEAGRFLQGYAHNLLGMVREAQGRLDESARCFEAALSIFRRVGNRRFRALALMNLGVVRSAAGDLDRAVSIFEQAIEASRAVGNRAGEADAIVNLGTVLSYLGNLGEAERHLRLGLELEREVGNRRAEAMALGNLGIAALERGELRTAEELLRAAVDTSRKAREKNFHALYLAFHGAVRALLGEQAEASAALQSARAWFRSTGDLGHQATVAVLEAFLDLPNDAEREARMREANGILDAGGTASRSAGTKLALRLLEGAIGRREGRAGRGHRPGRRGSPRTIAVGPEATWLEVGGSTIDLGRQSKPRRLLRVLVERRLSAPGVGVAIARLAEEGWPGERAPSDVVANRVYVALNKLRDLGLRGVLLRRDDGYLIDPGVDVRLTE